MATVGVYKKCFEYILGHNVFVYSWHITDKSLVYYDWGPNGTKGKRTVIPLKELV